MINIFISLSLDKNNKEQQRHCRRQGNGPALKTRKNKPFNKAINASKCLWWHSSHLRKELSKKCQPQSTSQNLTAYSKNQFSLNFADSFAFVPFCLLDFLSSLTISVSLVPLGSKKHSQWQLKRFSQQRSKRLST